MRVDKRAVGRMPKDLRSLFPESWISEVYG